MPTRSGPTDVLVLGTGSAGLRAAVAAHRAGARVRVIGRRKRTDAHTILAAGGINAALATRDAADRWEQHWADTVREGHWLCDPVAVEILCTQVPAEVLRLADRGCPFARLGDGRIDQRYFGAHTWRRTCYAGDRTGRAVLETLDEEARELGIPVRTGFLAAKLLVAEGRCLGVLGFDLEGGRIEVLSADAIVLAAGGYTRLWRRSSSRRDENTGGGLALALDAGATLADMEMVQFHPTGRLTPEDEAGALVTEAVRGEGGRLFNARRERFMHRYDPERLELAPRDVVAHAIHTEIAEGRGTGGGGVFLDASHLDPSVIEEKLPRVRAELLALGVDIAEGPVEVAPSAHYGMGGIRFDPETCCTDVPGLLAAGEVTAGVHGANRLGGNSLAETLVFGRIAGETAAAARSGRAFDRRGAQDAAVRTAMRLFVLDRLTPGEVEALHQRLHDLLQEKAGVVRDGEGLATALESLEALSADWEARLRAKDGDPAAEDGRPPPRLDRPEAVARALDLDASLTCAEAVLVSALARRESRGAHRRADHPRTDPAFRLSLTIRRDADGRLVLTPAPIRPVPARLQRWAKAPEAEHGPEHLLE